MTYQSRSSPQGRPTAVLEQNLGVPMRYCLYARKSTEQDELQALSIESQVKEMTDQANKEGLYIAEIRRESHSAKDSGQRPIYSQLISDIRQGIFNGILCWAPDRLSRNAGDLGSIVDLMDQGLLKEIRTHGQRFGNNPNEKFLLMILCSQAKLENDNKGENVKRGLRAKCEQGWRPGRPPLGYLHDKLADKGGKKIFIDPKRAPFVKKVFEKAAYEQLSGRKIYRWLRNETDFTTRADKKITLSMVYRMLVDHFYYGEFEYPEGSDKWYKGGHEPIITKELFMRVREQLAEHVVERSECKEFAFTKLMKCGYCGSGITADEKFKKLSDGTVNRYVYYGCTRGVDRDCKGGYIREEALIQQFLQLLDEIDLNDLGIKKRFEEEVTRYHKFTNGVLGISETYPQAKKDTDMRNYAKYLLREGTVFEKRELISCLRSKLLMKDRKIILVHQDFLK